MAFVKEIILMTNENLLQIEDFIAKIGGDLNHVRRVLHISRILAEKENISYNEDALVFASYYHDVSAYPAYNPRWPLDHALESSKLVPELAREYGYRDDIIEIIVEAVKNHDKPGIGTFNETRLIRNADGVDYLGFMAVARDFSTWPTDMKKAVEALKRRKKMFLPLIDLEYAKILAASRVDELDIFIRRFEEESFGIY